MSARTDLTCMMYVVYLLITLKLIRMIEVVSINLFVKRLKLALALQTKWERM